MSVSLVLRNWFTIHSIPTWADDFLSLRQSLAWPVIVCWSYEEKTAQPVKVRHRWKHTVFPDGKPWQNIELRLWRGAWLTWDFNSVNGGARSTEADVGGEGAGRSWVGGIKGNNVDRPEKVPLQPRECDWVRRCCQCISESVAAVNQNLIQTNDEITMDFIWFVIFPFTIWN